MKFLLRSLTPTRFAALLLAGGLAVSAAEALAQAQPAGPEESLPYVVKPSDKLIRLSRDMLNNPADWNEVARFNRMKDPNFITPGQRLNIPVRLLKSSAFGARVISVSGDVRAAGAPLAVGGSVPEGASVQTAANSSAVVELNDGSQVKLLPNTLAQVVANRGYAMRDASASGSTTWFSGVVRLTQGALETLATKMANRANPLQIETPTSLVGVRGTQFRVAFDDPAGKNTRAEVLEGQVRADNPAQQSGADLPKGTGAIINPAQREVNVVKLLEAPDLSALPAEVNAPLATWPMPALPGAVAYRVQLASDGNFNQIVRDVRVNGAGVELGSLVVGNWFARVRGIDAQGIEGFDAVKQLVVRNQPQWRVGNSTLELANGRTVLDLDPLQADGAPFVAATYSAEVARDANFGTVIASPSSTTPSFALGNLQPGVYYIRLRAAGQAPDGAVYRFEIPGNWGQTVFVVNFALQKVR